MRRTNPGPWVSLAYTWRLGAVRPQFKSGRAHLHHYQLDATKTQFFETGNLWFDMGL